jgi:hypothetical protein
MRTFTTAELARMTNSELSELYAEICQELERARPDSYRHEMLLITLDQIRRAFAAPRIKPPGM